MIVVLVAAPSAAARIPIEMTPLPLVVPLDRVLATNRVASTVQRHPPTNRPRVTVRHVSRVHGCVSNLTTFPRLVSSLCVYLRLLSIIMATRMLLSTSSSSRSPETNQKCYINRGLSQCFRRKVAKSPTNRKDWMSEWVSGRVEFENIAFQIKFYFGTVFEGEMKMKIQSNYVLLE